MQPLQDLLYMVKEQSCVTPQREPPLHAGTLMHSVAQQTHGCVHSTRGRFTRKWLACPLPNASVVLRIRRHKA